MGFEIKKTTKSERPIVTRKQNMGRDRKCRWHTIWRDSSENDNVFEILGLDGKQNRSYNDDVFVDIWKWKRVNVHICVCSPNSSTIEYLLTSKRKGFKKKASGSLVDTITHTDDGPCDIALGNTCTRARNNGLTCLPGDKWIFVLAVLAKVGRYLLLLYETWVPPSLWPISCYTYTGVWKLLRRCRRQFGNLSRAMRFWTCINCLFRPYVFGSTGRIVELTLKANGKTLVGTGRHTSYQSLGPPLSPIDVALYTSFCS